MKTLAFLFGIIISSCAMAQEEDKFDTLIMELNNNSLDSLVYIIDLIDHDQAGNEIIYKSLLFSNDKIILDIVKLGKANTEKLLDLFLDKKRDYAANIILYMLYKEDGMIIGNYYLGTDKIDDWQNYWKQEDLILWKKKFGMI